MLSKRKNTIIDTELSTKRRYISGMGFLQLFHWFQLFSSWEKLPKVPGHSQNWSKIDHLKRGCRWFQIFYIDFQLFYFITRIIPDIYTIHNNSQQDLYTIHNNSQQDLYTIHNNSQQDIYTIHNNIVNRIYIQYIITVNKMYIKYIITVNKIYIQYIITVNKIYIQYIIT